ncbi:MAG: entericidin [Candidatus Omnitrophota bacterium]
MRKLALLSLLAVIVMASLAGCNAARGAGTDLKNAGGHIENIGK